ncbi:MAG TPA: [FeFe] hydrogenase H-cluster maturation GTPase HydF [Candidatus Scybalocola faecavium]|nr:[FeFe] hydrogenase H-cluster maturation GTPase HydF [Candidatus Scybalocola faecavium]
MSLNDTPRANRLHIGIFGSTNSGKSSLINALTGQDTALVSEIAGTTTDPVYKSMEIHGIGPCVFIDTAGFDDTGSLGAMRIERTREAMKKTDIALMVFSTAPDATELAWVKDLSEDKIPVIPVLNLRTDQTVCPKDPTLSQEAVVKAIQEGTGIEPVIVNAKTAEGIPALRQAIIRALPSDYEAQSITGNLAKQGDVVLLVMPQDIQAPKGRLILPQVQTIRELLDKKCSVLSCTTDMLEPTLAVLKDAPDLIITDSQVFKTVYEKKPEKSRLTSFSVLFAGYKGDIDYFAESVRAIDALTPTSKVLIAEACTHAPLAEDIGREKIPAMLRKKIGPALTVDVVSGPDFPKDLSPYDLIIHCGACMFNRKYVLSRIEEAKAFHVPMTNYGITIAYLSGILDKIDLKA